MTFAADHPLRRASWIWPGNYMYLYNHYAWLRRDFTLARVPASVPAWVSADKAYRLYVNGRYVCRGPARGYQAHWPVDEVELAPLLRPGANWITAECYNPGISTFQYIHQTSAGFIFAAAWEGGELHSDAEWLRQRCPARSVRTARYSLQLDFQEHADLARDCRAWITSPTPPQPQADYITETGMEEKPCGRPPYLDLEPRGIPLLREQAVLPAEVVSTAAGECAPGWEEWENVSWGLVEELRSVREWQDGPQARAGAADEWFACDLAPAGAGRLRVLTLKMPRYVVANLEVEVDGAGGGEVLDFQFHEWLTGPRGALHQPRGACLIALANRLRLAPGAGRHDFFHLLGFQVVSVVARNLRRPLRLRLRARDAGYPFSMRGGFSCSDAQLEGIHAAGRRTQQACALDAYVDTPWREQAQWWGDARVQAQNTFFLDGDARLLRRGILQIAGQPGPEGLTYGHAPTSAHNCVLPDFSLTWIMTIGDYFSQTGDIDLFKQVRPRAEKVLAYFGSPAARGEQGLLRHDRRFWYFGDWAELYKGEVPTLLNLWYLLALRTWVELLRAGGDEGRAAEWQRRAAAHRRLVRELLYDPRERCLAGGLDAAGERRGPRSVHDQTLALLLGLLPEDEEHLVQGWLLPYLRGEELDAAMPSSFWCTYVIEEMIRRGHGETVLAFIRRRWSPMLATGTTWEGFQWSEEGGSSASHAWSAHPCVHLVVLLGGVSRAGPAWSRVRYAPFLAADIDHVEVKIPTPRGEVASSWQRQDGRVRASLQLPAGVEAEVELPGHQGRLSAGRHEFEVEP